MKVDPNEDRINFGFGASVFSANGFLGDGSATIDELVTRDVRKMARLGVSSKELANILESIYLKASQVFGAKIEIKAGFSAKFFESRGKIPSPFRGHGLFDKGETVLIDKASKLEIFITKLGIAMIRKYSFFQGYGSRYRIDPEDIVKIMNSDE